MTNPFELKGGQALAAMKDHYILRMQRKPVLAAMKGETVCLSGPGWTTRLKPEDFLESFGHETFTPVQEKEGLDEERDRQYYKWRSEKQ